MHQLCHGYTELAWPAFTAHKAYKNAARRAFTRSCGGTNYLSGHRAAGSLLDHVPRKGDPAGGGRGVDNIVWSFTRIGATRFFDLAQSYH